MSFEFRYCSCSTSSFRFADSSACAGALAFLAFRPPLHRSTALARPVLLLFSLVALFRYCAIGHCHTDIIVCCLLKRMNHVDHNIEHSTFPFSQSVRARVLPGKRDFTLCVCVPYPSVGMAGSCSYICIESKYVKRCDVYFRWWSTRSSSFMCLFFRLISLLLLCCDTDEWSFHGNKFLFCIESIVSLPFPLRRHSTG